MRYAKIDDGVVVNVLEADEKFASEHGLVLIPEGLGIGDIFFNEEFRPGTVPKRTEPSWIEKRVNGFGCAPGYPSADRALDAFWHAMHEGLMPKVQPWFDDCASVKSAFPKPD